MRPITMSYNFCQQNHRFSVSGMNLLPTGLRELDERYDKLTKENFDLKLACTSIS